MARRQYAHTMQTVRFTKTARILLTATIPNALMAVIIVRIGIPPITETAIMMVPGTGMGTAVPKGKEKEGIKRGWPGSCSKKQPLPSHNILVVNPTIA